jgi:hypothetical protein
LYLVSDRAKALIKLAETGLECPSIPDVFHLLYDLGKGYSLAISSQLKAAHQALSQVQAHLDKLPASGTSETEAQAAQSAGAAWAAEVSHWEQGREASRAHRKAMSLPVFPWRGTDSTPQTSQEVAVHLTAEGAAIHAWLATHGLPVQQQGRGTVRQQLAGLAGVIDLWWQALRQEGQSRSVLTPRRAHGLEAPMLPCMSGSRRCGARVVPGVTPSCENLEAVRATGEAQPLTAAVSAVCVGWKAWATAYANSSAGRRRSQVWALWRTCLTSIRACPAPRQGVERTATVIVGPRMGLRQPHGFRREFSDLFETVEPKAVRSPLASGNRLSLQ